MSKDEIPGLAVRVYEKDLYILVNHMINMNQLCNTVSKKVNFALNALI